MFRIALGLTCVVVSVLIAAAVLGLLPDAEQAVQESRKRWTETIAMDCALALARNDSAYFRNLFPLVLRREPSLQSIGVRDRADNLVGEAGGHAPVKAAAAAADRIQVPLAVQGEPWGQVEFHFAPRPLLPGFFRSFWGLALFVGGFTMLGISGYLGLVLRRSRKGDQAADRVRTMLDTVAEGVLVLDHEERIVLANRSFVQKFGAEREDLAGCKVHELPWLSRDKGDVSFPWVNSLQQKATEIGAVLTLMTRPGGPSKFSVNSTPVLNEVGECKGALATFDDLTEIENKNAELSLSNHKLKVSERKIRLQARDLRTAKAAAEAASRAKSEFLANVSHEIRTPMNTILGMTDVALGMELPEEQRECFGMVKTAGENLLDLINELLDFSKIEAGKFQLHPEPFRLRKELTDTIRLFESKAHRQGLELLCDLPGNLPDSLVGDAARLRQILINLIGNALKFTTEGQVLVGVRPEPDPAWPGTIVLHFQVQDTGIGIPADKHESIFLPFEQADGSTTRNYGGTGLGLSICAELVRMMAGRIWVESNEGAGSTFHFLAAFTPGPDLAPVTLLPDRVPRGRALLVEGNRDARRITSDLLARWSFPVEAAASGTEALRALEVAHEKREPFSLVLIGTGLPDIDAFDLAQVVRTCCPSRPNVLMLLAGVHHQRDAARCRELGVDATLVKPVLHDNLARALRRAFHCEEPGAAADKKVTPSTPGFAPNLPRLRILLVDDNDFNQRVGELKLVQKGHTVRLAGSGHAALQCLRDDTFDLMLLDMQMPDMDGIEVARQVRSREVGTLRRTPIIALTAHASSEVRARCLDAGMDGYLSKPIKDEELWRTVVEVLTATRRLPAAAQGASPPRTTSTEQPPLDAVPAPKQAVLDRVGGNRAMLKELVPIYQKESEGLLERIRLGLQNGAAKDVQLAAHSLKSMLAFFEAEEGAVCARSLEFHAEATRLDAARELLEPLTKACRETLEAAVAYCT